MHVQLGSLKNLLLDIRLRKLADQSYSGNATKCVRDILRQHLDDTPGPTPGSSVDGNSASTHRDPHGPGGTFTVTNGLRDKLEIAAQVMGVSLTDLVKTMLEQQLPCVVAQATARLRGLDQELQRTV